MPLHARRSGQPPLPQVCPSISCCCSIVSLVDIFEIDNNTFATVLELVAGGDLDAYCKLHEVRMF